MSQRLLNLSIPAERPMVPIEAAIVLLNRDYDSIVGMVDAGELPWAWDIRSEGAKRREIRVWRDNLLDVMSGATSLTGDEGVVLDSLIGHKRDEVRSPELQRIFSCSHNHIFELLDDKLITATKAQTLGVNGFARISRVSVFDFLRARRVV